MNRRFVVIDIETTGNSPKSGDRIIQIGIVVVENNQIVKRYSSFVNPEREIPAFITQLTGINESMVRDAPTFVEIVPTIVELLKQGYFVAHNVSFDFGFLQEEFKRIGETMPHAAKIDTVELSRILIPTVDSYRLGELAQLLHLRHDNPHQADSDAEVTAKLLLTLLEKLNKLPVVTLQQLRRLSKRLYSDLHDLLDQYIQEKKLSLKGLAGETSFHIYQGVAIRKWEFSTHTVPWNDYGGKTFIEFMEKTDTLPIERYEDRSGQWNMMYGVYHAFESSEHTLIEAGTGIGKSLAYLIPCVFFSLQSGKRVVISTYTRQLQQQLMDREIPIIRKIIDSPFSVALLKGRRNYISVKKFVRFLEAEEKNYDQALAKCQILVWLTETETGDVDELNLPSGGKIIWPSIYTDSTLEAGKDAAEFDFFQRAKEIAAKAQIIITNHAFLLQDLKGDVSLLPSYEHLLIDEAHQLEEVAAQYFGRQVSYASIRQHINRIGRSEEDGCLGEIKAVFEKLGFSIGKEFKQLDYELEELQFEFDELFRMIRSYILKKHANKQADYIRYRIEPFKEVGTNWRAIQDLLMRIVYRSKKYVEKIRGWQELLVQYQRDLERMSADYVFSYFTDIALLEEKVETLQYIFAGNDNNVVRWIEADVRAAANAIVLFSQPLQLDEIFADRLFAKKKSVVLTSATLTVNETFTFIISRLGLTDFYPKCISIPSPFDLKTQAKMLVPSDLPAVKDVSLQEYASAVASQVLEIAGRIKGKMLVLFTSYELLKMTANFAKEMDSEEKYVLIAQGVHSGSAAKLSKHFRQFENAILFGTSSFWEGVDFSGDQLCCVVIVRLPFAPPDDPAVEAKCEIIRNRGGNPFYDYSLPQAVMRFKQGVGRLIRSENDRGAIFVFDKRIVNTRYGKQFLASIPPINVYEGPLEDLLDKFEDWFFLKNKPD